MIILTITLLLPLLVDFQIMGRRKSSDEQLQVNWLRHIDMKQLTQISLQTGI